MRQVAIDEFQGDILKAWNAYSHTLVNGEEVASLVSRAITAPFISGVQYVYESISHLGEST